MSEDLSAFFRTAITIVLNAALVAVIANISVIGISLLDTKAGDAYVLVNNTATSNFTALAGEPYVNAVTAYKILESNSGSITDLKISINGTVFNDLEALIRYPEYNVKVTLIENYGYYKVTVTGVV